MVAKIDHVDSTVGVVRGYLNADIAVGDRLKLRGVGFNSTGKVVLGAGQTGIKGLCIFDNTNYKVGDVADVFKLGEAILNGADILVAGTSYSVNTTTGVVSSAAASGTQIACGYTVEADRFVIQGMG